IEMDRVLWPFIREALVSTHDELARRYRHHRSGRGAEPRGLVVLGAVQSIGARSVLLPDLVAVAQRCAKRATFFAFMAGKTALLHLDVCEGIVGVTGGALTDVLLVMPGLLVG